MSDQVFENYESEPNPEELGIDSEGQPIYPDALILDAQLNIIQITSSSDLYGVSAGMVLTPDNIAETKEHLRVELLPDQRLNLEELEALGQEYWEKVDNLLRYKSWDREEVEGGEYELFEDNDLTLEDCPILYQDNNVTFYLQAIERTSDGIILRGLDIEDTRITLRIGYDEGSAPFSRDKYASLVTVDTQDGPKEQIVFSRPSMEYANSVKRNNLERISSEDDVLGLLQKDFPWLEAKDLKNIFVQNFKVHEPAYYYFNNNPDTKRLKAIYPPYRQSEIQSRTRTTEEINPYEKQYLAGRNYARLAEFAIWANSLGDDQKISAELPETINDLTPVERFNLSLKLMDDLESGAKDLLTIRWLQEKKLFGDTFLDPIYISLERFVSEQTIERDYAALHMKGLNSLITQSGEGKFKWVYGLKQLAPEKRYEHLIKELIDVTSHENGHLRPSHLEGFAREEIWNEWKSVIYPHWLRGDTATFRAIYQFNPATGELGGAMTIQRMFEDLLQLSDQDPPIVVSIDGQEFTVDQDLIKRSALASSFLRRETGVITHSGQTIPAFASLYDQVTGADEYSSFLEKVNGCSDLDYKMKSDLEKNQGHSVNPETTALRIAAYNYLNSAITEEVNRQVGVSV